MYIIILSRKWYLKSKLNGLYACIFTKVEMPCSQRAMSRSDDWESTLASQGMREMEAMQLQLGHSCHAKRVKNIISNLRYDISTMLYYKSLTIDNIKSHKNQHRFSPTTNVYEQRICMGYPASEKKFNSLTSLQLAIGTNIKIARCATHTIVTKWVTSTNITFVTHLFRGHFT